MEIDQKPKDSSIDLEFSKHSLASCIRRREKQGKSSWHVGTSNENNSWLYMVVVKFTFHSAATCRLFTDIQTERFGHFSNAPSIWAHELVGPRRCQAFWPAGRLGPGWFHSGGIFLVNPALTLMTSLSSLHVTLYQVKSLMFYSIQTTNLTFVAKYEIYSN